MFTLFDVFTEFTSQIELFLAYTVINFISIFEEKIFPHVSDSINVRIIFAFGQIFQLSNLRLFTSVPSAVLAARAKEFT